MADLISRRAAINALEEYLEEYDGLDERGLHSEKWCAMSEAKMAIEALPATQSVEMRWIPCAERPPKEGENVFVYLFGQPYIAWFDGSSWRTEDFDVDEEYAPVAWMPLPKSWKGEE